MNKNKYLCKLCNTEVKNMYAFFTHLRWNHSGITTKMYYDKYFKKHGEGKCQTPGCNNQCNFENLSKGYHKHCSRLCSKKDPEVRNKLGPINQNTEQIRNTCLRRYGVKNPSQLESVKEQKKQTCLNNNGYEHWVGSDEHVDWMNNGGAAYCNRFIKNPSKPQIELYKKILNLCPYAILNYPSCGYSIDIAIPFLNIAIEYDGSYWHGEKDKDRERDIKLGQEGWKITRFVDQIPSSQTIRTIISNGACSNSNVR